MPYHDATPEPSDQEVDREEIDRFVAASVPLTGFSRAELYGTGVAAAYLRTVLTTLGQENWQALWIACSDALARTADAAERERLLREGVMCDPRLGPAAQAIIKMWYLGQWEALPKAWHARYGGDPNDATHVVSAEAYREGLVWPAMGTHPMGAKQPGHGTWSAPPTS